MRVLRIGRYMQALDGFGVPSQAHTDTTGSENSR